MKKALYCIIVLLLIVWGCKKEEESPLDSTRPIISNVSSGKANHTFNTGETIQLRARFSDETELGQYKVEIHDNFDGHSHGKNSSTTVFEFRKIQSISGKVYDLVLDIPIPEMVSSGPYHLMINCLDKKGNEAEFVLIDLNITSPSQPVINIPTVNGKDASKEVHISGIGVDSASLRPAGDITDTDGLEEVKIKVMEAEHAHGKKSGGDKEVWAWEKNVGLGNKLNITELFAQSPIRFALTKDGKPAAENHYDLIFIAKDKLGNYAIKVIEIHAEK
jgi:hypothetical protein